MHQIYLFLLFFVFDANASQQLIKGKYINNNNVCFYLSADLCENYIDQPLSLSYPQDINLKSLPPSIVDIPLITNIIPVVWLSGNTYTIEEMDEDLYYSLIKIKKFFKRFFYNTSWDGELKPTQLIKNSIPSSTIQSAALFTIGLDSTATVLRHFDEKPILISFNIAHKNATDFTQTHHLDFSTIYINHYDFLNLFILNKASIDISKWFWDTTMGLAWVGAAAPFLYAKGISILYIPSGFTWNSFMFPDGQTLEQPACPLIDENLSPAGLQVHHDAFTMTRTDKIKFISTFCTERNISKPQLIVCNYHNGINPSYTQCNTCFKCYVTMLDILAIGDNLQDYGFTLAEEVFINQFKAYMETLTMRRGGTYVAYRDTQQYIRQHIETLPETRRSFYDWFLSIDLDKKITKSSKRPLRTTPFRWEDYQDLYPSKIYS